MISEKDATLIEVKDNHTNCDNKCNTEKLVC